MRLHLPKSLHFQKAYNGSNSWFLFDGHEYKGSVRRVFHRKKILSYACRSHPDGGELDIDGSATLNQAKQRFLSFYIERNKL